MSGGDVPPRDRLAESVLLAVSLCRDVPDLIRTGLAPRLDDVAATEALHLADTLAPETCCTGQVEGALRVLIDAVDAAIARGTRDVELPPDGTLLVGNPVPVMRKRREPWAEAMHDRRKILWELFCAVRQSLDLAMAIQVTDRLLEP